MYKSFVCFTVFILLRTVNSQYKGSIDESVLITSSSNIKYIEVPTSDDPILTWMEVRKGIFPNVTTSSSHQTKVNVGDPVTLFIFFKDISNIYDVKVTDCWAYDEKHFSLSQHKLQLNGKCSKNKMLTQWKQFKSSRYMPSFLYASFTSFKFPDKNQIYLTCDIQVIGRKQNKLK